MQVDDKPSRRLSLRAKILNLFKDSCMSIFTRPASQKDKGVGPIPRRMQCFSLLSFHFIIFFRRLFICSLLLD